MLVCFIKSHCMKKFLAALLLCVVEVECCWRISIEGSTFNPIDLDECSCNEIWTNIRRISCVKEWLVKTTLKNIVGRKMVEEVKELCHGSRSLHMKVDIAQNKIWINSMDCDIGYCHLKNDDKEEKYYGHVIENSGTDVEERFFERQECGKNIEIYRGMRDVDDETKDKIRRNCGLVKMFQGQIYARKVMNFESYLNEAGVERKRDR